MPYVVTRQRVGLKNDMTLIKLGNPAENIGDNGLGEPLGHLELLDGICLDPQVWRLGDGPQHRTQSRSPQLAAKHRRSIQRLQ